MIKRSYINLFSIVLSLSLFIVFTSCQNSPESSLVVNKDIDKLIEEAVSPASDKVKIENLTEYANENFTDSIKNKKLGVTVEANARVHIPETDKLSVLRVEQMDFTQELVDKIRYEFLSDTALYEGAMLEVETKAAIAESIASFKNQLEEARVNPDYSEDQREAMISMYQENLDKRTEEYNSAPDEVILTDYPSDMKLHKVSEKLSEYGDSSFYSHQYTFNENGDVLFAVSDGADGSYSSFYVQNNEKSGNKLSYRTNPLHYESNDAMYPEKTKFILYDDSAISAPDNFIAFGRAFEDGTVFSPVPGETVSISQDDAITCADKFLERIGIDAFSFYEGGLYSEPVYFTDDYSDGRDQFMYRTYYILRYYRNIDGAFVTQASNSKEEMADPRNVGGYSEYEWDTECLEFRINDSGIVGFDYNTPITVTETVVENSYLKSFDAICTSFKKMMPVVKASTEVEQYYRVDTVKLSYGRISIPDSYNTGLIIPLWDFSGSYEAEDGGTVTTRQGRIFCINAIDGSIIDPLLGY